MTARRKALPLGLLAVMVGCQSSSAPNPSAGPAPSAGGSRLVSSDQAVYTDPSALRLEDIDGAILLFYHIEGSMPPKLEDLRSIGSAGADLNFNSPSGQPYGYVPGGLSVAGTQKLLVVYDPVETANGQRWCILISPPQPGAALSAEVMALPEIVFRAYLASEP
jgi:hypothetical protein